MIPNNFFFICSETIANDCNFLLNPTEFSLFFCFIEHVLCLQFLPSLSKLTYECGEEKQHMDSRIE